MKKDNMSLFKQMLNAKFGKECMATLCCERCAKPYGGKMYQIRVPLSPICYGSDDSKDVALMHPHFAWRSVTVCEQCYDGILEYLCRHWG